MSLRGVVFTALITIALALVLRVGLVLASDKKPVDGDRATDFHVRVPFKPGPTPNRPPDNTEIFH